jgi:hypothetical protein
MTQLVGQHRTMFMRLNQQGLIDGMFSFMPSFVDHSVVCFEYQDVKSVPK